jgi:hypothetical protein
MRGRAGLGEVTHVWSSDEVPLTEGMVGLIVIYAVLRVAIFRVFAATRSREIGSCERYENELYGGAAA